MRKSDYLLLAAVISAEMARNRAIVAHALTKPQDRINAVGRIDTATRIARGFAARRGMSGAWLAICGVAS